MDTLIDTSISTGDTPVETATDTPSPNNGTPKTREEQLVAKREYMRARRAAERAKRDKLIDSVDDVAGVEEGAVPARPGPGTAPSTETNVSPVPSGKPTAAHIRLCEKMIADSVKALSDSYVLLLVHPDCPSIGDDRSALLGEIWGRYLAPYIDPNNPEWVGITMASVATLGVGISFSRDVSSWKKSNPDKVKPKAIK